MRSHLVRLRSVVLHVVALGVVASFLTVASDPARAAETADRGAGFQAPAVGECRMISVRAAQRPTNNKETVDCATKHTSRVIAVGRVSKQRVFDLEDPGFFRKVAAICEPAANAVLGRTAKVRAMSAYSWVWFVPTKAQRAQGARWIRCDLILNGGVKLRTLPTDEVPALGALPHPAEVARCLTTKFFTATAWAGTHTFRATGAFTLRGIKGYPSLEQFQSAGLRRCPALTDSDTYRWFWPSSSIWALGDHTVVCYTETKK